MYIDTYTINYGNEFVFAARVADDGKSVNTAENSINKQISKKAAYGERCDGLMEKASTQPKIPSTNKKKAALHHGVALGWADGKSVNTAEISINARTLRSQQESPVSRITSGEW